MSRSTEHHRPQPGPRQSIAARTGQFSAPVVVTRLKFIKDAPIRDFKLGVIENKNSARNARCLADADCLNAAKSWLLIPGPWARCVRNFQGPAPAAVAAEPPAGRTDSPTRWPCRRPFVEPRVRPSGHRRHGRGSRTSPYRRCNPAVPAAAQHRSAARNIERESSGTCRVTPILRRSGPAFGQQPSTELVFIRRHVALPSISSCHDRPPRYPTAPVTSQAGLVVDRAPTCTQSSQAAGEPQDSV
jgi:hypothetical protein